MKKKKQVIIIGTVLVLLAAAALILAQLNKPEHEIVPGELAVIRNGEIIKTYTYSQIAALPYVEQYKEIISSSQSDSAGIYRGVPLYTLLQDAEPSIFDGSSRIIARAEDLYVTSFPAAEVMTNSNIIVAYMLDGKPLPKAGEENAQGPFRIVVLDDEFGTRNTKFLSQIEVS